VELLRTLSGDGHDVRVIQTPSSREFVGKLTFEALSGHPVAGGDPASPEDSPFSHIDMADCDLMIVAPATANTIAKMAAGIADNLLLQTYLAGDRPVILCPAMNAAMWNHPAVRENIERLKARGVLIVPPEEGDLACGGAGVGRLADLETIREVVRATLAVGNDEGSLPDPQNRDFVGLKVLISAGATREPIDSVRYISNRSSGRMGFSLAAAAAQRGAGVTVVAANCDLERADGVRYIDVSTTDEMSDTLKSELPSHDILIMAAAICDYKVSPKSPTGKLERKIINDLQLIPTSDIVRSLGNGRNGKVRVGFAAEFGGQQLERARTKMHEKQLDMIVFNDVSRSDIGFESPDNEVVLLSLTREDAFIPKTSKIKCANRILDEIHELVH
jgi:phosphopantothenoylcysteine decarboxylase/phosphopantothenate--cysteine ligase